MFKVLPVFLLTSELNSSHNSKIVVITLTIYNPIQVILDLQSKHTDHPFVFVPRISEVFGHHAFECNAPSDCNNLPSSLRSLSSFHHFKASLFIDLFTYCF